MPSTNGHPQLLGQARHCAIRHLTLIWRLRAALAYRCLAPLNWRTAWRCTETLLEIRIDENHSDALRKYLSYWRLT